MFIGIEKTNVDGLYIKDNKFLIDANSEYYNELKFLDGVEYRENNIPYIIRKGSKYHTIKYKDDFYITILKDNKHLMTTKLNYRSTNIYEFLQELHNRLYGELDINDLVDLYTLLGIDIIATDENFIYLDGYYIGADSSNLIRSRVVKGITITQTIHFNKEHPNDYSLEYLMDFRCIIRVGKHNLSLSKYVNLSDDLGYNYSTYTSNKIGYKDKHLLNVGKTHLLLLDVGKRLMWVYDIEFGVVTRKRRIQTIKSNNIEIKHIGYTKDEYGTILLAIECTDGCETVLLDV